MPRNNLCGIISFSALIFAGRNHQVAFAKVLDMHEDCAKRAEAGECEKNPDHMFKTCPISCEKQPGIVKSFQKKYVRGDPLFFDLSAGTAEGNVIDFERFEGYLTLIVDVARDCAHMDDFYTQMEHLQSIYPYTVEVLVFPFRPADWDDGCSTDFQKIDTKKGRKIHIMEECNINGPNTHPVYKYLKDTFELDDLNDAYATFFVVNPDGNAIDMILPDNFNDIQSHVERHLNDDLSRSEKLWG